MALSQVQCLDDNHVNWRTHESKPEFFYSEDQRLALEALIHEGPHAFQEYVQEHSVRPFLSEVEQKQLISTAEVYQPGSETLEMEGTEEGDDEDSSLHYWPERSDDSIPELDMGWPEYSSYRGVTRVHVFTQPPMDGQMHIKEVVRKSIAQAQKVIAVVMDLFTDVDIFKDLLDASFKRKVAVYIILEATGVSYFLSMCERASMHTGHLKNLRVRCSGGTEFLTRSRRKVCGSLSQKFMFVDGDKAVSGSYSYTWTASRLDRNIITVVTGQAVETFDKQFRELYLGSRGVSFDKVSFEAEPEPEPAPEPVPPPVPTVEVTRKLINPKYALVSGNATDTSSKSSEKSSPKNSNGANPVMKFPQRMKVVMETPPIHPGLVDLERANLIPYLPTWPEPDPPSDVIGFINVRDANKPVQSHLMRSEQFETSQAIRFRDPIGKPEEPLTKKATQEPQPENPGTASCNASEDTQRAKNEAEGDSHISMTFEECHDSTESATPATECPGSGNSEVQKPPDELNTSTVSQPATEQHPQRQPPNQPKPGVIQNHTDVYVNANSKKSHYQLNQTTPRPPASNIRSQQASQGRGGAKMAAAKPDGCVQPAKVEGIGRHAFWQGKQLAQGRPGQGYPPRSQDKPASYRSSSTGRVAQGQQEDRPNLLTRSSSFRLPQEQMGRSRPGHQGPPGHRQQLLPQGDGHASFGLPFTRFSHLKTIKGKMAEGPLGSLQRKAPLESKGAV